MKDYPLSSPTLSNPKFTTSRSVIIIVQRKTGNDCTSAGISYNFGNEIATTFGVDTSIIFEIPRIRSSKFYGKSMYGFKTGIGISLGGTP